MGALFEYIKSLFKLNSGLGIIVILSVCTLLVIVARRLNHRKHLDSNGRVVITPRFRLNNNNLPFTARTRDRQAAGHTLTVAQQRLLSSLYRAHEVLFGLIVMAGGIALICIILVAPGRDTVEPSYFSQVIGLLMGALAIPLGLLCIVFRNAGNPFRES